MQKNARHFIGGLAVTLVLIGMICGFILVDLSSERYMPGMFAPIYLIDDLGAEGISIYWMGQIRSLEIATVKEIQATVWNFRGLIPRTIRLAGGVVAAIAQQ